MPNLGRLVVLNGAPRSGKSTLVKEIQNHLPGIWVNLGVDAWSASVLPPRLSPGLGLRPGESNLDLEAVLPFLYLALYESAAAHVRQGINVVMDLGHHDSYSKPLQILPRCARALCELPAYLVGVHCPIEVILERRKAASLAGAAYLWAEPGEEVPLPVLLWQSEVHKPGIYDLTLDTSLLSPTQGLEEIEAMLSTEPTAFRTLAALTDE